MARVVFMGTPEYAIPSLNVLHEQHQVVLVVTQPDRPRGRGRKLSVSPVKAFALEHELPLWQPRTLRTPQALTQLQDTEADLYVTAAIGLILPANVLALPAHGCLNLHASLLPRWRGAAPISAAILHGDGETGVTLMQTDEGLDTGPILAQVRCPIGPDDTTETLTRHLSELGAGLLSETLPRWLSGEIVPQPQPAKGITTAPRIQKRDGRVDWRQPAVHIERMIRAFTPWPGVSTVCRGRPLKILRGQARPDWQGTALPGQVLTLPDNQVAVATGEGALVLLEIQMAGKRPMSPQAFCRGQRDFIGSHLEEPG